MPVADNTATIVCVPSTQKSRGFSPFVGRRYPLTVISALVVVLGLFDEVMMQVGLMGRVATALLVHLLSG